jgi:hypothetical protein
MLSGANAIEISVSLANCFFANDFLRIPLPATILAIYRFDTAR